MLAHTTYAAPQPNRSLEQLTSGSRESEPSHPSYTMAHVPPLPACLLSTTVHCPGSSDSRPISLIAMYPSRPWFTQLLLPGLLLHPAFPACSKGQSLTPRSQLDHTFPLNPTQTRPGSDSPVAHSRQLVTGWTFRG